MKTMNSVKAMILTLGLIGLAPAFAAERTPLEEALLENAKLRKQLAQRSGSRRFILRGSCFAAVTDQVYACHKTAAAINALSVDGISFTAGCYSDGRVECDGHPHIVRAEAYVTK